MLGYDGQKLWQLSAGMLGSVGKARCQRIAVGPGSVGKARWLMGSGMLCSDGSAIKVDALQLAGQGNGRVEVTEVAAAGWTWRCRCSDDAANKKAPAC